MTTLTILRGVSGSGKSTWARQQNAVVVSRDDIRVALFGPVAATQEYYLSDSLSACEQRVTISQDAQVAGFLKAGMDVIVDNTNVEWKFVKALAKIGYRYGAAVEVKVFDVIRNQAIMRDQMRFESGGRYVGGNVITKQYDRFQSSKNMTLEPVFIPKPYNGTPGKPWAVLCDLDGTLADFKDVRGPYDTNVENDKVFQVVSDLVWNLDEFYEIVFMSGRKEAARAGTEMWLSKYVIDPKYLYMRADDDNRPDNLVKVDLFNAHVRDNFNVQFALDDRDQVVDTYRRMGLTVLQCAEGDF